MQHLNLQPRSSTGFWIGGFSSWRLRSLGPHRTRWWKLARRTWLLFLLRYRVVATPSVTLAAVNRDSADARCSKPHSSLSSCRNSRSFSWMLRPPGGCCDITPQTPSERMELRRRRNFMIGLSWKEGWALGDWP